MAERDATGGRTPRPGSRGGGGGGTSAAAASRIRVDVSDVNRLKKALKDTHAEAKLLGDTLAKFDDKSVKAVRAARTEVEQLQKALGSSGVSSAGTGGSSGGGGGGTRVANQNAGGFSGGITPFQRIPLRSYLNPFTPHSGADLPADASRRQMAAATPAAAAAAATLDVTKWGAGLANQHFAPAWQRSYLMNQYQLATGGSTAMGAQQRSNMAFGKMMGGTSLGYADVTQAMDTLMGTGAIGGAAGRSRMASVGFLSTVNPLQGNAASAQQLASTFTPQNYYAMRLAGVNAGVSRGQNMEALWDQIIDRYEAQVGRKLTPQEIQSGATQQGTGLNVTLIAMGVTPDQIPNLVRYWIARNITGKRGKAAINQVAGGGFLKSAQQAANARGQALSAADRGLMKGYDLRSRGATAFYDTAGNAANSDLGSSLTEVTGALSGFTGMLGKATTALHGVILWSIATRLLGPGGRGIPPVVAGGPRGGPRGGGGGGAAAKVATVAVVADFAHNAVSHAHQRNATGHAWDPAGPAEDFWAGVSGTGKDVWGGYKSVNHAVNDFFHYPWGGSDDQPNIWGGSGATYMMLERMVHKRPGSEIITSTTSGQHAQNSYHYKGQAIDVTDKAGSRDSAGLLSINHWMAEHYGSQLAELIYAGPGGINIKNGKRVSGSFYGAATMAGHHDHVHIAATPGSLGMPAQGISGPGTDGSSGGPPSAASSGGFSSPMSALSALFSSSSGGALIAALASSGGMSMGGGYSGGGGGGGGGSGNGSSGPYSAPRGQSLGMARLTRLARAAGFSATLAHTMAAIAMAESGGRTSAHNTNTSTGDNSYGLWQINMLGGMGPGRRREFGISNNNQLFNPTINAHAAFDIYRDQGLAAWSTYKNGSYQKYMSSYDRGAWNLIRDEIAQLHKGEMVLPAGTAAKVRQMVDSPQTAHAMSTHRVGGVPVQLIFNMQGGSEAEAREHARRFARFVREDHGIELEAAR